MNTRLPRSLIIAALAAGLGACSGSTQDVRVTFCKHISAAAVGSNAESVEWTDNENTFRRPEYATAALSFSAGGNAHKTACFYEYEALDDTAQHLADPFSAYATLPFAMTVDGRMLADAELLQLRNDEQIRHGKAVIGALESGARDLAARIRAELAR